ncbi:uncharacterized protein BDW43DRAFT_294432 [Aspergillus alliaceus]|uniref:uncharacterized protein n=1 Tax=Petromyces alliaceus TaxID=209559 RepID=UPI0012A48A52|nr:uncharacterized protein BDW43DRAFT_294432 [Aspergillus alliaceus]KAB8227368.1 hypothetical protein BDW43DRAFT_294432 [Aspergillus alliaceus]
METKNLILRGIDWRLGQQDLRYISRKQYGKLLPVPFRELGRARRQLGIHASVFAVDLKCPQALVLVGPLSMIAIIIVDKCGLLFISPKDMENQQYESEVLRLEKEHGAYGDLHL